MQINAMMKMWMAKVNISFNRLRRFLVNIQSEVPITITIPGKKSPRGVYIVGID